MQVVRAAAAVLALLAFALPSPASADHVRCGDVITQDTTLDGDVVCTADDLPFAVTIGANGVTLDLNGHTIRATTAPEHYGVGSLVPRTGVRVVNGSIAGFERGIFFDQLRGSVVERLSLDNLNSVWISGDDNSVLANDVHAESTGIDVRGRGNLIRSNAVAAPLAIDAEEDARIVGNAVQGNVRVAHHGGGGIARNVVRPGAIQIFLNSDQGGTTVVEHNEVAGASIGIDVLSGGRVIVQHNFVTANSVGIDVEPGDHVVRHNQASGNLRIGIYASGRTLVTHNVAARNGEWGIFARDEAVVTHNRADHNGGDGILAAGSGPGDDGSPPTFVTVGRNTANYNGDLGIEAYRTNDAGGNRARGNGNPAQCIGITCR